MAHFEHGAIDKETSRLVDPASALKRHPYECPDCHRAVYVKKGPVKVAHFAHNPDPSNSCTYYDGIASRDQRHKNAQLKLKQFLERGCEVNVARVCPCGCRWISHWGVNCEPSTSVKCEHRFVFKDSNRSADVAVLNADGSILCIFEIVHTHFTREGHRPEPWHEIRADEINAIPSSAETIQLSCIREVYRPECLARQELERQVEEERRIRQEREWREARERRLRQEAIRDEENRQHMERWREQRRQERMTEKDWERVEATPVRELTMSPEELARQRNIERQRDARASRQADADSELTRWLNVGQTDLRRHHYERIAIRIPSCMMCVPFGRQTSGWSFGRCAGCNREICAKVERELRHTPAVSSS